MILSKRLLLVALVVISLPCFSEVRVDELMQKWIQLEAQLYADGYNVGLREYKENILKIDRLRRNSEYNQDHQPQNTAKGGNSAESPECLRRSILGV